MYWDCPVVLDVFVEIIFSVVSLAVVSVGGDFRLGVGTGGGDVDGSCAVCSGVVLDFNGVVSVSFILLIM